VRECTHVRAPGPERQSPATDRWVAQVPDRLADLGGGLQLGQHDPDGAQVERAPDAQALRRRRAHDRDHGCGSDGVEERQQVGFGRGAMLEIEHDPVEARPTAQLRRQR
jgi:hypothetical protein